AFPPEKIQTRLNTTLELAGLTGLRSRRLDTLSGGERQRVALAAVLALSPTILVLDEPTSQLDPEAAECILQILVRLNKDQGLTILLAEHRLERILPFINSMIYMDGDNGSVLHGEPRQVLAKVKLVSPVIALAKQLGWQPLPLTVEEARPFAENVRFSEPAGQAAGDQHPPVYEFALSIENLHVYYGPKPAITDINLGVQHGEILALMGPNGAGKTTLLRTLVGLVKPDRGTIRLLGEPTQSMDTAELSLSIGYLPQDPNSLLFAESVLDELLFTLRSRAQRSNDPLRLKPAEWEANAAEVANRLLSQLDMADLAAAYPRDLSVGQRQRVALGAIMVARPKVLLLDEPTRGLDAAAKEQLAEILRNWRDEGHAIILVTHDVELAARIADRIALLEDGNLTAVGQPAEVLSASPVFTPQILQLFPDSGCLTPEDLLRRLNPVGTQPAR
ncbi:MAG TPA: ATP-binding cassette domain-containing protein, partial [Anaerolineales bacterium]|nr:ATP-binding cassette domain-containing protein [Anaerolineales bacterium]